MKSNETKVCSRFSTQLIKAFFVLAAVICAIGTGELQKKDVYAGDAMPGGTYKVSTLAGTENWQFSGNVMIEMDVDAEFMSLDAGEYNLYIKGNKTLTIRGNSVLIRARYLTVEDAALNLTINEGEFEHANAIDVRDGVSLRDVNLSIKNPLEAAGIYAPDELEIKGGSASITSISSCITSDKISIEDAQIDFISSEGMGINCSNELVIKNTTGSVRGDDWDGLYTKYGAIQVDNCELRLTGALAAIDSYNGEIILADNIYVKSPSNTKICQVQMGYTTQNSVLCNADGTPVKECVIARKRVSDAICKVAAIPDQPYTGSARTPAVSLTWDGKAMRAGTDYTVTYKNNTQIGTATATITGKGNYTGSTNITFRIKAGEVKTKEGKSVEVKTGGAKYTVTKAGATLTAPTSKSAKSVTVPATIKANGKTVKVTAVAPNAFKGMKKLTKVTIGKNVKSIGTKAFYGCKKLKKITIKTSKLTAKKVGTKAFTGIHKKAVIKSPKKKVKAYRKIMLKKGMKKTMIFK